MTTAARDHEPRRADHIKPAAIAPVMTRKPTDGFMVYSLALVAA
jgi:hypothetical protein